MRILRHGLGSHLAQLAMLLLLLVNVSPARDRRNSAPAVATPGQFDHYVLALSWAPNFCATHDAPATECASGRRVAFVVHGLWPEGEQGRLNTPCQSTSPVSAEVVRYALNFYPSAGLVQHEWQCHGIYSGLSATDYFNAIGKLLGALRIPSEYAAMQQEMRVDAMRLPRRFGEANGAPAAAFTTSCHDGELVAVEACYTRDLRLRSCPVNYGGCSGSLRMRPPR